MCKQNSRSDDAAAASALHNRGHKREPGNETRRRIRKEGARGGQDDVDVSDYVKV